jgi:predicted nucleic acid-binding protein
VGKARARVEAEMSVTFDTGALIALERGDSRMIALLQLLVRRRGRLRVPAGVVGQAWRGGARQAVLARLFSSPEVDVASLDQPMAQACGELCASTSTSDVIDASVVLVAREHDDTIVTSDVEDLRRLDPSARLERI